ncbi:MAG: DUF4388 domain-containing protein [Pelovirga sp.]
MTEYYIDNQGWLKLPPEVRQPLATKPLELLSVSDSHLMLAGSQTDTPVLLAGVVEEGTIADLLSYFNMFRKTGVLTIVLQGGTKALYFQQGEVVYATSTFAAEDLGAVLFSLGKIEKATLLRLRGQASQTTTLGKLLVEQGAVSPKDLWLAARSQVENILYNLFRADRGAFYFQLRPIEQEQVLRLSMSTQNMIMEGLRRLDETALFMRKILSLDAYPVETGAEFSNLTEVEARLLSLAQFGQLSACDLFRRAGLREFDGIRTLYSLIEKGVLRMEEAPGTAIEEDLGQILTVYNSLFQMIFIKMKDLRPAFVHEISAALKDLQPPYSFVLRDVELRPDGTLDGHSLVANLAGLDREDKKKLLVDSLSEVAYLETMMLRRELPAEQARPLIARVQENTARARVLAGRSK